MDLEPGPFAVRDPMPLRPRVVTPHLFEGLAADLVGVLGGVDGGLGTLTAQLALTINQDVDPTFLSTLAGAVAGLEAIGPAADQVELAAIAGNGAAIGAGADAQQLDLPGPDETEPPTDDPPFQHEPGPSDEPEPGGPPPI